MEISISPELILARERRRKQLGIFIFLALAVVVVTFVLLINPATTQEYEPTCGLEAHVHGPDCFETVDRLICETKEQPGHVHDDSCYKVVQTCVCGLEEDEAHEHSPECFVEERILVCELPENEVHEHTADCIEWRNVLICGLEDDPEHEHSEDCWQSVPVFVCEEREGVGHVHNEFCYLQEEVLTCTLPEHEHTDDCYPRLTGDPHADVEIDFDWESTFCDVEKTGVWAEDLIAIASSQIGYAESALNFVTDEYNVQHGYTRYGDWYGNRYAGWNAIFVMFCLHYADVWGIPTDSVPANWMNSARAQGFWTEADGEPIRGDLVFFDDDADGFADRIAIVTEVREDEIDILIGGTGTAVQVNTCARNSERIVGYLALPLNPDFVTLEEETENPEENPDMLEASVREELSELPEELSEIPKELSEMSELLEETIPVESVPFSDPYAPVTLFAETEDGVRATLNTQAAALPYPAEELTLVIREAEPWEHGDMDESLNVMLEDEGTKVLGIRWLDFSVWHEEQIPAESVRPDPASEADEIPKAESEEFAEEFNVDKLMADDLTVEQFEPVEDFSNSETNAELPLTEKQLVQVTLAGPVEITLEGLTDRESILAFLMQEDGTLKRLEAEDGVDSGSVTVQVEEN